MKKANGGPRRSRPRPAPLRKVSVAGYKSFAGAAEIEIRPLTLLAGANSSGKSSMMQPLLLMKQTLEALYDPGGLKLDGPHVKMPDVETMFSRAGTTENTADIVFGFELDDGLRVDQSFQRAGDFDDEVSPVSLTAHPSGGRPFTLRTTMRSREIGAAVPWHNSRRSLASPSAGS